MAIQSSVPPPGRGGRGSPRRGNGDLCGLEFRTRLGDFALDTMQLNSCLAKPFRGRLQPSCDEIMIPLGALLS